MWKLLVGIQLVCALVFVQGRNVAVGRLTIPGGEAGVPSDGLTGVAKQLFGTTSKPSITTQKVEKIINELQNNLVGITSKQNVNIDQAVATTTSKPTGPLSQVDAIVKILTYIFEQEPRQWPKLIEFITPLIEATSPEAAYILTKLNDLLIKPFINNPIQFLPNLLSNFQSFIKSLSEIPNRSSLPIDKIVKILNYLSERDPREWPGLIEFFTPVIENISPEAAKILNKLNDLVIKPFVNNPARFVEGLLGSFINNVEDTLSKIVPPPQREI